MSKKRLDQPFCTNIFNILITKTDLADYSISEWEKIKSELTIQNRNFHYYEHTPDSYLMFVNHNILMDLIDQKLIRSSIEYCVGKNVENIILDFILSRKTVPALLGPSGKTVQKFRLLEKNLY